VDNKNSLRKESSIFRFLKNTYKEYLFIICYKILAWDMEEKILSSFEVVNQNYKKENEKLPEKI